MERFKDLPVINRINNCSFCDKNTGFRLATMDYWDIKRVQLVICDRCGLAQLDPKMNESEIARGCEAYYVFDAQNNSLNEQKRNQVRNFRRGVLFGYKLKKMKIRPGNILELGPGTGFFSAGIQFVFPGVVVSVMDIVPDVLDYNERIHGFKTYQSVPEKYIDSLSGQFDIIIARDIIEHVPDVKSLFHNVSKYLKTDGIFHFITPNGHEDSWRFYLTRKLFDKPAELLINHVNYFDGRGLRNYIEENGFIKLSYYTYKISSGLVRTKKGG